MIILYIQYIVYLYIRIYLCVAIYSVFHFSWTLYKAITFISVTLETTNCFHSYAIYAL